MATKKQPELDQKNVDLCLIQVRKMYEDYTPQEIQEAFIINRREITEREQLHQLQDELAILQSRLDAATKG